MAQTDTNIVIDHGGSSWSDLWTKEDYLAIWLGFFIIAVSLIAYFGFGPREEFAKKIEAASQVQAGEVAKSPFKTIAWYKADDDVQKLKGSSSAFGKFASHWTKHPGSWKDNPLDALVKSDAQAKALNAKAMPAYEEAKAKAAAALVMAQKAEEAAGAAAFKDQALNDEATAKIADWRAVEKKVASAKKKTSEKAYNLIPSLIGLCAFFIVIFGIGITLMKKSFTEFARGFVIVFLVAVLAYMLGGQAISKQYGFGAEAWGILLGMIIANSIGTPRWVLPACQVEFFIKTGLVLLGAEVLFGKIMAIGIPGIFVAWVVTPIVLICTFIFGQKIIKMPSKTLNIVISADMSVCGTSAAIATAAACRAKKEELTLSIGLSLVFTAIMMIAMPAFIKAVGMPEILGGAWMGGTIDSTGAVAAAGAFLGDKAMYVAATIKMIQNVMIGVTAFCVALYWCTRVERQAGRTVGTGEIWHRFPKFVLGFLVASILFSLIDSNLSVGMADAMLDQGVVRGGTRLLRDWFFSLSFAAIGLSTNFRELAKYFKGGKPLILYVCGQSLNLVLTLTMAYIMFYLVFPEITAKI
ncbi:putative sulfate exporter family transporter [Desulfopila sp. IMCC35006]|uniref:YeiH family protein n=1 Tax=Desulfopila sp. IMCC35006 TaxID=2569542 RepID=UPI0010AC429A|nr:putative sulfate exporter family transporter [Desulfopila sp. IMCC35006]TKB28572.1 putative sulfate exporter family transporter [Desulfopila sp. IMCC35006]